MTEPLLRLRGVTASYGKAQALFDVSLQMRRGEVLAMLGRNGMGKTTTIRAILGLSVAGGEIDFGGEAILGMPAHRIARRGIGLVPEGRRCFAGLTVSENLRAAARPGHWTETRVALCRCGASKNKPFCDGSHWDAGFEDDEG